MTAFEEMTTFKAIDTLNRMPHVLAEEYQHAITFAVNFMKERCEKPSLDRPVYEIKYYNNNASKWGYYKHVPTGETIKHMTIGDLVNLVKTGALDLDKFESIYSFRQRRLEWAYVDDIKRMLFCNGYITEAERAKDWRKK